MTKYSRFINVDGQQRAVDVINAADYEPRPDWWTNDSVALDKIFAPNKAAWVAAGQWFVQVLRGVQDSAVHTGNDFSDPLSYVNPDGTDGNGEPRN